MTTAATNVAANKIVDIRDIKRPFLEFDLISALDVDQTRAVVASRAPKIRVARTSVRDVSESDCQSKQTLPG
jgi:hypothetical protein